MSTLIVGCGYLGRRVGEELIRRGERVMGTVRSPGRAEEVARLGIEPVILDVVQAASVRVLQVRFTPDALTLATIARADLECVIAALKEAGDVAGQVIPLASLSGASGDDVSAQLTVTFRGR